MEHLEVAKKRFIAFLGQLRSASASAPVSESHAFMLFIVSFATIVTCCASTTICVRAARDSNIAMNAMKIRRKYHRNMQLYMLVREKMLIDKQAYRAANGLPSSSLSESKSFTEDGDDTEETSSFMTSS